MSCARSKSEAILMGDSVYPLLPFLMKPFCFSPTLSAQKKRFNYRMSRAMVVVEVAFGCLKSRCRRLAKKIDMHIDNIPHIIAACCILHNVCEVHNDDFNEEWLEEVHLDQPDTTPHVATQPSVNGGDRVHSILIDYFNNNPL